MPILFALFLLLLVVIVCIYTKNPIDKIVYINLDKRKDRRKEIESELNKTGLSYERFSAIKDERGAIGCCKSHLAVLKKARDRGYKNILVLEDDFKFVVDMRTFHKETRELFKTPFDVCLFGYTNENLSDTPYSFLSKITDAQTTSGYLVQSHYYDALISQWEYGLRMFQETGDEPRYTCDQSWKPLQEKDNWVCFKNRMGVQRESYSDIQNGVVNYGI